MFAADANGDASAAADIDYDSDSAVAAGLLTDDTADKDLGDVGDLVCGSGTGGNAWAE